MRAAALALAGLLAGCASNPAPPRYRVSTDAYPRNPRGSWVVVRGEQLSRSGELIAVGARGLYLGDGAKEARRVDQLTFVRFADIREIRVYAYDTGHGIALWTTLGLLSTISHGVVLILSAPIWILSGSIAGATASRAGHYTYEEDEIARLVRYARFPQGLPPSWLAPPAPEPVPEPAPTEPQPEPEPLPGTR